MPRYFHIRRKMSEKNYTHSIELIGGYTDKDKNIHKKVTFGNRLTVGDLILLDNDPQGKNPTQYQELIRRKMITEFGTLKMPVPLNVLLSLDSIDCDDLEAAGDQFLVISRCGRTGEYLDGFALKLPLGFVIDGTEYTNVQFGNRITGKDRVEADAYGAGVAHRAFLIGKQISKISTEDDLACIDGQVKLDMFKTLDAESLNMLWAGAEIFRQSFRFKRKVVSGKSDSENGVDSGDENGLDGNGNS